MAEEGGQGVWDEVTIGNPSWKRKIFSSLIGGKIKGKVIWSGNMGHILTSTKSDCEYNQGAEIVSSGLAQTRLLVESQNSWGWEEPLEII